MEVLTISTRGRRVCLSADFHWNIQISIIIENLMTGTSGQRTYTNSMKGIYAIHSEKEISRNLSFHLASGTAMKQCYKSEIHPLDNMYYDPGIKSYLKRLFSYEGNRHGADVFCRNPISIIGGMSSDIIGIQNLLYLKDPMGETDPNQSLWLN